MCDSDVGAPSHLVLTSHIAVVRMGRHEAYPVYISLQNFTDNVRCAPVARTLVALLQLPEPRPCDSLWRHQLSSRLVYQKCLQILLDRVNVYRLGFPLFLRHRSLVSILVPRIGLVVADIVEQRNLLGIHSHFAVRCGARVTFTRRSTPVPTSSSDIVPNADEVPGIETDDVVAITEPIDNDWFKKVVWC